MILIERNGRCQYLQKIESATKHYKETEKTMVNHNRSYFPRNMKKLFFSTRISRLIRTLVFKGYVSLNIFYFRQPSSPSDCLPSTRNNCFYGEFYEHFPCLAEIHFLVFQQKITSSEAVSEKPFGHSFSLVNCLECYQ